MTDPLQQYLAKLAERHLAVRRAWEIFQREITKGQQAGLAAVQQLRNSLSELGSLLTRETTPRWLQAMVGETNRLVQPSVYADDSQRVDSVRKLWGAAESMDAHSFSSLPSAEIKPLISVDQVVEEHFTVQRRQELDNLYDSAIKCIHDVVQSGKIDSKKITQDLQRILATIEDAKRSSFISQRVQISTLDRYLSAIAEATVERIPGLKFLHDVVKKADSKLQATHNEILDTLNRRADELSSELQRIAAHQPLVALASYDPLQITNHQDIQNGQEPSA